MTKRINLHILIAVMLASVNSLRNPVRWASANRALIAHRMANALSCETHPILDVTHNHVVRTQLAGSSGWLHRKGAAPADTGIVPVPGSQVQ